MSRSDKFANPFYILLVMAGLAFVMTATMYGVMATRANAGYRDPAVADQTAAHPLMVWMEQHGDTAIMTELAILAACTFGAIATDEYWQRRAAAAKKSAGGDLRRNTNRSLRS